MILPVSNIEGKWATIAILTLRDIKMKLVSDVTFNDFSIAQGFFLKKNTNQYQRQVIIKPLDITGLY